MLMPARYRAAHERGLARVRDGTSPSHRASVELEGLRKDGTEFPLELSLAMWNTDEAISTAVSFVTLPNAVGRKTFSIASAICTKSSSRKRGKVSTVWTRQAERRSSTRRPPNCSATNPELIDQPMHALLHHSHLLTAVPTRQPGVRFTQPFVTGSCTGLYRCVLAQRRRPMPVEYVSTRSSKRAAWRRGGGLPRYF